MKHLVPVARHIFVEVSQHPLLHASPAQQGLPGEPQVLHIPPLHTVLALLQVV